MDDGERGGATGVEMSILWLVLLLLIGAVVQIALAFYAGQLASTAAQDGVRDGRYRDVGSAERARAQAESFLARTNGSVLQDAHVTSELDPVAGVVRVHVTGRVLTFVPGLELPVDTTATGALERVTP